MECLGFARAFIHPLARHAHISELTSRTPSLRSCSSFPFRCFALSSSAPFPGIISPSNTNVSFAATLLCPVMLIRSTADNHPVFFFFFFFPFHPSRERDTYNTEKKKSPWQTIWRHAVSISRREPVRELVQCPVFGPFRINPLPHPYESCRTLPRFQESPTVSTGRSPRWRMV